MTEPSQQLIDTQEQRALRATQCPPGYGYFPWALAQWDPTSATTPTPHPGGFGPVPLGGDGYLITEDKGLLANCQSDLDAIAHYLAKHSRNYNTAQSYRREVERFLLWLGLERDRALSHAEPADLTLYDDLLREPRRWEHWYTDQRYPRSSPHWRPFVDPPLSDAAVHYALGVIHRMYQWLVRQGYLRFNPVQGSRADPSAPRKITRQERFLPQELWGYILDYIEHSMPREDGLELARYHRARWVFHALYGLLARAGEFVDSTQGSIYYQERPNGRTWWWTVRGKHRRPKDPPDYVPVPKALIEELRIYRQHLGLSDYPQPGETTPMIVSLYPRRDGWKPLGRKTIYQIVRSVCKEAAASIAEQDPQWARRLEAASTHWLRHTGITHRADAGIPSHELLKLSRLKSFELLRTYAHADDDHLCEVAEHFGLGTKK